MPLHWVFCVFVLVSHPYMPICNGNINQVEQMLRKMNFVVRWKPPDFLFTTKILRMKLNVLFSNVEEPEIGCQTPNVSQPVT